MDYIETLANKASQITMYDVKSYYNQAKNMVLNVPEMEAKVREATNDDPWGASSTLMMQIAEGTHTYSTFNEIMPCIYARFMEKEAREWRQIYKALTLLEFLIKNGSERVVDDARAHISTIKMLRSFHYIDEKSKDQGINVRNRASEIAILLGDVEMIRKERRKAKANRNKYSGTGNEGGGGMSFVTPGGSRYGGFGSESLGGQGAGEGRSGSAGGYDGDEYRSRNSSSYRENNRAVEFDEYEGADDFDDRERNRDNRNTRSEPPRRTTSTSTRTKPAPPPKTTEVVPKENKPVEKAKEVNLFDFGDDDDDVALGSSALGGVSAPVTASSTAPMLGGDDDFDDFQSAPTTSNNLSSAAPLQFQAQAQAQAATVPSPAKPAGNTGLFDLLNNGNTSARPANNNGNMFGNNMAGGMNSPPAMGIGMGMTSPMGGMGMGMGMSGNQPPMTSRPSYTSGPSSQTTTTQQAKPPLNSKGSAFDDLWTTSLSSINTSGKPIVQATPVGGVPGKTIKDLEQEKAMNKLWGSSSGTTGNGQAQGQKNGGGSGGFDDLLM